MAITPAFLDASAVLSDDRLYRYVLTRRWRHDGPLLHVVGLNPSTADAEHDDPTVRRIAGLVKRTGHSGFVLTNLFAYRATSPQHMRSALDPVGPENDGQILYFAALYETVLAWGTHGGFRNRDRDVLMLLQAARSGLLCWGRTKEDFPRHPLYLRADSPLDIYP